MKAIVFLSLLVLVVFASDSTVPKVNETSPGFIVGTWFMSGPINDYDPPNLQCCMPYGTIVITADTVNASQVHMTSNVWKGQLCDSFQINSTYNMTVPFPWNKTWDGLQDMFESPDYDYSDGIPNYQGIQFQVSDLSDLTNFANGTQKVETNFFMDYSNVNGQSCGIIMSKDTSGAFHYGVSGLLLVLSISFMSMF